MKKILPLLICVTQLFSLTISLNSAKEKGTHYAILHIQDNEPIDCRAIPQSLDKEIYLCQFKKIVKTPIEIKKMPLVNIDFLEKKKEFFIKIEPKVQSKLIAVNRSLYIDEETSQNSKAKKSKHWVIMLYKKTPFTDNVGKDGINFPIMYPKNMKPYIGALDLNGAPISYAQSEDIKLYIDLKKSYAKKRYENVISNSLDIVKKYPQTIFKSEILLYRLRAINKELSKENSNLSATIDDNELASEGKRWIKMFPSDDNLPEVLMMVAKSYLKIGSKADANYFLDILITEHKNSPFTKQSILTYADSIYSTRNPAKALKLYRDVLYSASSLDIASEAAIRLVDKEINRGKTQSAKQYLEKVLSANENFLLKDRAAAYALATKLAANKLYDSAAKIADFIAVGLNKKSSRREQIVRDAGLWHAKANEIQKAYNGLQAYMNEYKSGDYRKEVQQALDELFFELKETNETKLTNYYDTLISKYKNEIGDRAVVEKAKLLLSNERYKDVLKMQKALKYVSDKNSSEANGLILDAANALSILSLKDDNCAKTVGYIEKYNLDLSKFKQKKLFDCLLRTSRFKKANELSKTKIKDKNLKNRFIWLEKYLLSQYKLLKYQSVVDIGKDIIAIASSLKKKVSHDTLSMIFFSYMKLNKLDKALSIAKVIEKKYTGDVRNTDVYIDVVKRAVDDRNDLLLSQYAKKVITIQNKLKSFPQTPFVEFSYIGALKRLGKLQEALSITQVLTYKNISLKDKIRALYNAGELSMKLKKNADAKSYFTKCIKIKSKSSWKDICKQNLKLL